MLHSQIVIAAVKAAGGGPAWCVLAAGSMGPGEVDLCLHWEHFMLEGGVLLQCAIKVLI